MWQAEVSKNLYSSNYFNKYIIITFPMLFCTAFVDNLFSYIFKVPFLPGVFFKYTDVLLTFISILVCTAIMVLLIKFNKRALNIAVCVLVIGLCYVYSIEGNALVMSLDKCVISYYFHQGTDLCTNITRCTSRLGSCQPTLVCTAAPMQRNRISIY